MATANVPSSSSSTPKSEKYDVFLSFRGEDTRKKFISHLHAALCRKHIKTFKDNLDLEKGDEIKPELLEAIERSKFSVVVFSENYASSSWCLAELAHIIKCHKNYGKIVIPVFYGVEPTQVRNQRGSCGDAFVRHEQRLNDHTVVQEWREALRVAGYLAGFDSQASDYRDESELVEAIAEDILEKLKGAPLSDDFEGLVGIEGRIQKIESLLNFDSPKTRMVGIWGIGGLGKTTLAEVVFHKLSDQFKSRCFLANVREESEKHGLHGLLLTLVRVLLEDENIKLETKFLPDFVRERLRRTKVLVVLDDVDESEQLEVLLGCNCDRFCDDSRIIITTRNKKVLRHINVDKPYEVEKLTDAEAIRLFKSIVLRGNSATPHSHELIDKVVKYAEGIPLIIKLLASQLRSLQTEGISWETILDVLKENCHGNVEDIFKISYDGLNEKEKAMFLHIAFFFNGMNRDFVEDIFGWDSARIYMNNLIDKSLITIKPTDKRFCKDRDYLLQKNYQRKGRSDERIRNPHSLQHILYWAELQMGRTFGSSDKRIWMHDLLQEFGRNIVCRQSKEQLEICSRLWVAEEAYRVLNNNEGTEKIEGIFLAYSRIDKDLHLRPEVFQNMCNLRVLMICGHYASKTYLNEDLHFLPPSLRYIYWAGYPLKCFPSNFEPSNLVELHMPISNLEKLWDGVQDLAKLKSINLRGSFYLKQIPNLSRAPNLERINLQGCTSLVKVSSNTLRSNKLIELNLRCYTKFSGYFQERIFTVDEQSCFEECPIPLPRNLEALVLRWTATKEIPSLLIEDCPGLQRIDLEGCKMLESLPSNIFEFRSIRVLNLEDCLNLKSLPEISKPMEGLEYLGLANTGIRQLPLSIGNLIGIKELDMKYCQNLESIPKSIYDLTRLERLELSNCRKLENLPPSIGFHNSGIEYLHLNGSNIIELPPGIHGLKKLRHLVVKDCKSLRSIPELPVSLNLLDASGCTSLDRVSSSKCQLKLWFWDECPRKTLDFSNFCECMKMDQISRDNILNDFQLRVLERAIHYKPYLRIDHFKVKVWYPGNEIPKWFECQFEGFSNTIPLPPQWLDANFLGFAFCLVIDAKAFKEFYTFGDDCFNVKCKLKFKIRDTEEIRSFDWLFLGVTHESGSVPTLNSDHLLLLYQRQDYNDCLNAEKVSLKFSFKRYVTSDVKPFKKAVKWCGIHMLYRNESEDLGLNDNKHDDESDATIEESLPSEWEAIDADEESEPNEGETTDVDEPHPKKMKHSY